MLNAIINFKVSTILKNKKQMRSPRASFFVPIDTHLDYSVKVFHKLKPKGKGIKSRMKVHEQLGKTSLNLVRNITLVLAPFSVHCPICLLSFSFPLL